MRTILTAFFLCATAPGRAEDTELAARQLNPAEVVPGAEFGSSVAVQGDVAVVGSPGRGAVSIFEWNGKGWGDPSLECPGPAGSQFGLSIAVDDERLVVGAPSDGNGTVFHMERDRLECPSPRSGRPSPDNVPGEKFGWSVAVDGRWLAAGAPRAQESRGAVYVTDRDTELSCTLGRAEDGDQFGHAVALSSRSRLLVAGAPFAETTGVAYVYRLIPGQCPELLEPLQASDASSVDAFGFAVAVDNSTIMVGSPQDDDNGPNSGSVYFYEHTDGFGREIKRTGNATQAEDQFGIAVALDGNRALVGARRDDTSANDAGSVYFLERSGAWSETARWAGVTQPGAELGIAVALDGVSALAGAYLADQPGVTDAGTAYALGMEADLSVKAGNQSGLRLGETVPHEITIQNLSLLGVLDARMTFSPMEGLRGAASCKPDCDCSTGSDTKDESPLICTLDIVAKNESICCVSATVTDDAVDRVKSKVNVTLPVGVFQSESDEPDEIVIEDEVETRKLRSSVPQSNPVSGIPGEIVSVVFRIHNEETEAVGPTRANIHGVFDGGLLSEVSLSCDPGTGVTCCAGPSGCSVGSGTFSDTVDLEPQKTLAYRLRARVEPPSGQNRLKLAASVEPMAGIANQSRSPEDCSSLFSTNRSQPGAQASCAGSSITIEDLTCPFGRDVCEKEFQVNTSTNGYQLSPAVAGNLRELIFVWLDRQQAAKSSTQNILGRRWDRRARTDAFQINSLSGPLGDPVAGMDPAGHFVVVWESFDFVDAYYGRNLRGRRFKNGSPLDDEILIAPSKLAHQRNPDLVLRPGGSFLVVWANNLPTEQPDIFGQRFNARGEPRGSSFPINTYTTGPQSYPALAAGRQGDFLVVWTSGNSYGYGPDGSGSGIRGRRFASSGRPRGGEFAVNTYTSGSQIQPDVAVDEEGTFVVVWTSTPSPKTHTVGQSIHGRRFSSDGRALGKEFQVSGTAAAVRRAARVAMDFDGSFLVVWEEADSLAPSSASTIRGRYFDSDGSPLAKELQVGSATTASQEDPAVVQAADAFFVVWSSDATTDSGTLRTSLRGRRLVPPRP